MLAEASATIRTRGWSGCSTSWRGRVDHDDALNHITGSMGTGDLGILTEGRRGMIHQEWNPTDGPARAFILVYPNEPLAPGAAFDAVRDDEATRVTEAEGVITKQVAKRGDGRLHGEVTSSPTACWTPAPT